MMEAFSLFSLIQKDTYYIQHVLVVERKKEKKSP
jgi:hypothetical protein